MSQNINNYTTLAQIVKSYMNEKGEKALTNFERYLQLAIEGYIDMNVFEIGGVDVAYLDVDTDTRTVPLPTDFITETKVGLNFNGRVYTLTQNTNITIPQPEEICAIEEEAAALSNSTSITDSGFYWTYWYGGWYTNAFYGMGGGRNFAYYKIDLTNRVIIFEGNLLGKKVVLEYKSTGVKAGSVVPIQARNALKAYIHYASIRNDFRFNAGQIAQAEDRYNKELYSLQRITTSFTLTELLDVFYSTTSQSIKR